MLKIQLAEQPDPLYSLFDESMNMWISKRGHCTQKEYAKYYSKEEAEAIRKHCGKQNIKIRIDKAD
jgi:hypothetical protein